MNIAIRSTRESSLKLADKLISTLPVEQIYFVEPINSGKYGFNLGNIPVISNYNAQMLYKEKKIDKFFIPGDISVQSLLEIESELDSFNILKRDIALIPADIIEAEAEIHLDKIYQDRTFHILKYLEFHVADHCNLNCRNCTHFSPLVQSKVFANYEKMKEDFEHLKSLVDGFQNIRIMGGECLLNKNLPRYISLVREYYPSTDLHIVTNGLLTRFIGDELLESLRKNKVKVIISAYPIMNDKMDDLVDFLERKSIPWYVAGPISKFSKVVDLEKRVKYPFRSLEGQYGCECKNLRNGKIAICPTVCYADYYDNYHVTDKMVSLSKNGIHDLYSIKSFEELKKKIYTPCELCDYCLFYRAPYDDLLKEKWQISEQ